MWIDGFSLLEVMAKFLIIAAVIILKYRTFQNSFINFNAMFRKLCFLLSNKPKKEPDFFFYWIQVLPFLVHKLAQ